MRVPFFLFFLSLLCQGLHAQDLLVLSTGKKVEVEWAGRSGPTVEFVEQGTWKVLPRSGVKSIRFQPGRFAIGVSYLQPFLLNYRRNWMDKQFSTYENILPNPSNSFKSFYWDVPMFLLDLEMRLTSRLTWGGFLGFSQSTARVEFSKWGNSESEYSSISSDWYTGLLQGYVKWYDPSYRFFVFGGPGLEIVVIEYRYYYNYWNQNGVSDFDFISIYNDPVKIRPAVFGGGGLYLIQRRNHALSLDAQVRFSGRVPVYIFEERTRPEEPSEKVNLFSSFLRLTYSFKVQ